MKKLVFIFSIFSIISCTKIEEVIIPDNTHPPDNTIENITIETYINKLYISIIGHEPTSIEFDTYFKILRDANLSQESRELVITEIINDIDYYNNLFKLESLNILNGLGQDEINTEINCLTNNDPEWQRMKELQEVFPGLVDETISILKMHKRMVNNSFYDDINMGAEHFVVSVFQTFIQRYPTDEELYNGKEMLKPRNAILFLQSGSGKEDFINIFFESDAYFMGQTNILFIRYLFRNPTSEESVNYSLDYRKTKNMTDKQQIKEYKELQKRILSTDEFIGL